MVKNVEIHSTGTRQIDYVGRHEGGLYYDACHEKTDLKVFVVVMPKEGWARVAVPILLLV